MKNEGNGYDYGYDLQKPAAPGWYAVCICWDRDEGSMMETAEWDGAKWLVAGLPIFAWSTQRFDTQAEAKAFADANDISA